MLGIVNYRQNVIGATKKDLYLSKWSVLRYKTIFQYTYTYYLKLLSFLILSFWLQFSQIEDMFSKIIQWFTADLLQLIRPNELNEISL